MCEHASVDAITGDGAHASRGDRRVDDVIDNERSPAACLTPALSPSRQDRHDVFLLVPATGRKTSDQVIAYLERPDYPNSGPPDSRQHCVDGTFCITRKST